MRLNCADLIGERWNERLADLTLYMNDHTLFQRGGVVGPTFNDENEQEYARKRPLDTRFPVADDEEEMQKFWHWPLSFDWVSEDEHDQFFQLLLSWGGPSDMLRFRRTASAKGGWEVEYRYHDWSDGAGMHVTDEPAVQRLVAVFKEHDLFTQLRAGQRFERLQQVA